MSRKKRMQSVREAKDRRAKKIAIGGGVLLALLLAWEVPHYLGGHKSATAPPAATTTDGSTAGTTPGTTTPAPGVTGTPVTATPTASSKLPNSDTPPRYAKGQLASFSTFSSKDPFEQQVTAETGVSGSGSGSGSASASAPASGTPTSSGPVVTSARTLAQSGVVMLMVNGKRESVRVGAGFPSANPVFRLVSVSRAGVRIGIANGSYSSGAQTILLRANRTVTLVDTTSGARYRLQVLVRS
jgi:hypothetical protein